MSLDATITVQDDAVASFQLRELAASVSVLEDVATSPELSPDIRIYRGASETIRVTVVDADGEREDLTGATVYFCVKEDIDDTAAVIELESPTNITILSQLVAASKGRADIELEAAHTSALDPGDYLYDIWVELASEKRYAVMPPAMFVIAEPVTDLA